MNKSIVALIFLSCSFLILNCRSSHNDEKINSIPTTLETTPDTINLLTDIAPLLEDGDVNAVIEIPAGTIQKWELDKSTGKVHWELIDNKPRIVNYIGYPGNYGMIPQTILSKEHGGDGDPLDILVLGPPTERSQVLKCKIIGVLLLTDNGEQDDKLIAVSYNSPLYGVNNMNELNSNYKGVAEIIQLWFTNYKGPGKMESKGFGNKKDAINILSKAIDDYIMNKHE